MVSFVTKSSAASAAGGGSQQHHALSVQEPDSSSMRKEIDELRTEVQQLKNLLNQSMMSQPNKPRGQGKVPNCFSIQSVIGLASGKRKMCHTHSNQLKIKALWLYIRQFSYENARDIALLTLP